MVGLVTKLDACMGVAGNLIDGGILSANDKARMITMDVKGGTKGGDGAVKSIGSHSVFVLFFCVFWFAGQQ